MRDGSPERSSNPGQTERMPEFHYNALGDREIRLIRLLPGAFEDDIYLQLIHKSLETSHSAPRHQVTRQELQRTLEGQWRAFETPEGRWSYITSPDHEKITHEFPFKGRYPALASRLEREAGSNRLNPSYTAISYVWGDDKDSRQVHITRAPFKGSVVGLIKIGQNLDAALRHLRHNSELRTLWIDAICINQKDDKERSTQVARMNRVYGLARSVVVWLGPSSEDSRLAITTLEHLGRQFEFSLTGPLHPTSEADHPEWANPQIALPYDKPTWDSLLQFFTRPWFSRLWVMQEIALANGRATVNCGGDTISFPRLRRAMVALARKIGVPLALATMMHKNYGLIYGFARMPMVWLLETFCQKECSDARDRLYGILGLLGPQVRRIIQPSYTLTAEAVYKEVFLGYSKTADRLDMLTECVLNDQSSHPSWVPDWRRYPMSMNLGYTAGGISKAYFRLLDGNVLEVKGRCCGTIKKIKEPYSHEKADAHVAEKLHELRPDSADMYPTGEIIEEAWLRTLCLDTLKERHPRGKYGLLADWRDLILKLIKRHSSDESADDHSLSPAEATSPGDDQVTTEAVERFWARSFNVLRRMCFFHTDTGHFGFGPLDLQPDDKVFVILGVWAPLILRPTSNPPGGFRIVRWCYVHGIMDGEALLGPLPANWIVQRDFDGYRFKWEYLNIVTQEKISDDPRLGSLEEVSEWKRMDRELLEFTADDPVDVDFFMNSTTGEKVNHHPNMTFEKIEKRGVQLETVRLV